jgi:ParB family chromosome partitioning protein
MTNATLAVLPLDRIVFDSKQPRKFFDESAMTELVNSVKQVGILQPIMVRPGNLIMTNKKTNKWEDGYTVICGERRLRAAYEAELTEIPVVIREGLSEEEILEIQITENLQRKDVNPMEEAVAFDQLLSRFSIEDIANRVGKSAQFVAQRLSLTNLSDKWQQVLFEGKITLTQAYKLARIAPETQDEGAKECLGKDGSMKNQWAFSDFIQNEDHNLDNATFKTDDADLYPEAGACGSCRYNSASNALLFPDLKKRICHNGACWSVKTTRSYKKSIAEKISDPTMLFVSTCYSPDKDDKSQIKAAEELGATVVSIDKFETIEKPDEPAPYDEWLSQSKEQSDFDEMDEKEQKEFLKDAKAEYAEYEHRYKEDLAQYEQDLKIAMKAFVVAGDTWKGRAGEIVYVKPKKGKSKELAEASGSQGNAELILINEEISGIQTKMERNRELDREKVMKVLVENLKSEDGGFLTSKDFITGYEIQALIFCLAQDYRVKEALKELHGVDSSDYYQQIDLWNAICSYGLLVKDVSKLLGIAARHYILSQLAKGDRMDPQKWGSAAALHAIACQHMTLTVEKLEIDQNGKASKREATMKARIEALEAKKAEIQEQITREKNEATSNKAQAKNKKK